MTATGDSNRIDYDPDGIQTVFPYDFEVDDAAWMIVYADGSLYESNPYTVSGIGVPEGGSVTFTSPPDAGITTLTLIREVPMTQETVYPVYGPFPAKSHENALDKLTWIAQQQQEELNRAFVAPIDGDPEVLFVPATNVSVDDDAFTIKGATQQILDAALDTQVTANVADITTNAQGVSDNAAAIIVNAQGVSDNAAAIIVNAQGVSDNAAAIVVNAQGVSDNAAAIVVNARPDVGSHIIDGDFNFWYEGDSQTSDGYGSDTMWFNGHSGSTKVHSKQAFVLGQTDVPGNPKFFSRTVVTSVAGSSNYVFKKQRVESVLSHSGETKTFSFNFKADSSKNIAIEFIQNFGTGGTPSPTLFGIGSQLVAVVAGWARYEITVTVPSVSGKTLGTDDNDALEVNIWFDAGSALDARTAGLGQQPGTFDITRVRLVEGTVDGDDIDETYAEVLQKVSEYYENSYNKGEFTGQAGAPIGGTVATATSTSFVNNKEGVVITVVWKVTKRSDPIVTIYNNDTGAINEIRSLSSGIAVPATTRNPSTKSMRIINTAAVTVGHVYGVHWAADSRL